MTDRFDVIIVGAGPAGSAAAYCMAKAGLSVLVLERGEYPGAKNTSGAVFYGEVLSNLLGDFWQQAPVERWITKHIISFLGGDSSIELRLNGEKPSRPIGVSVLRTKFDRWFAQKAADAGALVLTSTLAEDLIFKNGRVSGVRTGREEGEVYADVVVAADGANSLLAAKAGLRSTFRLQDLGLGVKEVIKLPSQEIEQRFHLAENEGAAYAFVGEGTQGLPGGCFLYTNRESVSLGLVVSLKSLGQARVCATTLLDYFKEHPTVAPLISGGILKEYSAHLIPAGGYYMVPQLYADGILVVGDAAGLTLNSGLIQRGMDFAIASGIAAAEAVKSAKEIGDFSKKSLSYYEELLKGNFILQDLRRFRHLSRFLHSERIYKEYPAWLNRVAKRIFTIGLSPRKKTFELLTEEKPERLSLLKIAVDILRGWRNL